MPAAGVTATAVGTWPAVKFSRRSLLICLDAVAELVSLLPSGQRSSARSTGAAESHEI